MRHLCALMALSLLACPLAPAAAQVGTSVQFPAGYAASSNTCTKQTDGTCVPVSAATPLPTAGKVESGSLVTANAPAAAITLYGGRYVVSGLCASYGTGYQLRARGPDGATMQAVDTAKTAAAAVLYSFGSGAVVDVTVSGTTGCNVSIARVPE